MGGPVGQEELRRPQYPSTPAAQSGFSPAKDADQDTNQPTDMIYQPVDIQYQSINQLINLTILYPSYHQ